MTASLFKRALFRFHIWLSAKAMPLRVRGRSFENVLKLAPLTTTSTFYDGLPAAYIARRAVRVARNPWFMRDRQCLRQGLLGSRFLRSAGYDPELVFGVDTASIHSDRLSAHCWVCLDGKPVISDSMPGMIVIYRHRAAAQRARP